VERDQKAEIVLQTAHAQNGKSGGRTAVASAQIVTRGIKKGDDLVVHQMVNR
jgi:hypothetical protein